MSRVVMQEEPGYPFLKPRSYSTNSLNQTRQYFLFHHPKSHPTIIWNQLTSCLDHVRCSNGCWSSTAFVIFEIFTAVPKSCIPLKKPVYKREHCHHNACFISWKISIAVLPVLRHNLLFTLCSITTNPHNDLHGTKS
jgi:hypothetical protein